MTKVTSLHEMDGLPFTPSARLPHPSLLARWKDAGLIDYDLKGSRFILTESGRAAA